MTNVLKANKTTINNLAKGLPSWHMAHKDHQCVCVMYISNKCCYHVA